MSANVKLVVWVDNGLEGWMPIEATPDTIGEAMARAGSSDYRLTLDVTDAMKAAVMRTLGTALDASEKSISILEDQFTMRVTE